MLKVSVNLRKALPWNLRNFTFRAFVHSTYRRWDIEQVEILLWLHFPLFNSYKVARGHFRTLLW